MIAYQIMIKGEPKRTGYQKVRQDCLGAAQEDKAEVFNNICNLGSMAMTGFIFG